MFKTLKFSDFSPTIGSSFQVRTEPDISLELELLEAVELNASTLNASTESSKTHSQSFSLLFKGPNEIRLPQQVCPMSHSDLGELSLFLVPVGLEADGIRYEAIFN